MCFSQGTLPVHCLANGDYCVYEEGIDIFQVFGPPYSSPSLFSAKLLSPDIDVETTRENGSAVYVHKLYKNGKSIGTITDFVCSRLACFCRLSELSEPVSFSFSVGNPVSISNDRISITDYPRFITEYGVNNSIQVYALPGVFVYQTYPSPFGITHQAMSKGAANLTTLKEHKNEYLLEFGKGQGMLYLIGGPSFIELNDNIQTVFKQTTADLLAQTRNEWSSFSGRRLDFSEIISDKHPDKQELLQVIDDVSVLLKTQQGKDGGVLAGHKFHLAYIRDEYGVSRAFLALGYKDNARQILNFYYNLWKKFGFLHNAQAIGIPGIFHRHENDEVEITGYLLIQAFDYLEKTGDQAFLREMVPLLNWCWMVQKKNLAGNMLPFNGDETYIAGGMVSRKILNDGSSEATLLFIEGGRKFLKYLRESRLKSDQWLKDNSSILDSVANHYRSNFIKDGRLLVNNPDRIKFCAFPEYRYGVCLYPSHGGYQGILKHFRGSLYFCQECYGKASDGIEPESPEEFFLPSIYLMPIYVRSTLFSRQEKESMLNELVRIYRETGQITISQQDKRLLGYDYGLFLYALNEFNHPLAGEIYRKLMDLRDESGTWCEYYLDDKPYGCRYRPWESGINAEAVINYMTKTNSKYH